jgi:hypothetical protein
MSDRPVLTADDIRYRLKSETVYDLLQSYPDGFRVDGDDTFLAYSIMIEALAKEMEALRR